MDVPNGFTCPRPRRPPRRWFPITYYILIIILHLSGLFFWRPISAMNLYLRARMWIAGVRSNTAQVGAYRIHFLVAGSGRPVVLLHGLGGNGTYPAEQRL